MTIKFELRDCSVTLDVTAPGVVRLCQNINALAAIFTCGAEDCTCDHNPPQVTANLILAALAVAHARGMSPDGALAVVEHGHDDAMKLGKKFAELVAKSTAADATAPKGPVH